MLMPNGDGTYTTGPYDLLAIVQNTNTGRYHAYFLEEKPLPSWDGSDPVVRLKSKLHHTEGAVDFEGALVHLADMQKKFNIPNERTWREPKQIAQRDFEIEGYALVTFVDKDQLKAPE